MKKSAEKRLIVSNSIEDNNENSAEDVKERMLKIIEMGVEGEKLEDLRCSLENIDLFRTFVDFCLIHFTTSINWRYKACNMAISDIFTESDEALCILLIENNADDYVRMYHEKRKIGRREAKPRYTKVECSEKKFKGWDKRGISRFNKIVTAVKRNREMSTSKEMEMKLKANYAGISGNVAENDIDDSNDDEGELEDVMGYDGFAGANEDGCTSNENNDSSIDVTGATNLTPV